MALTFSVVRQGVDVQGRRTVEADVAFDASYPTGGEPVDLVALGLERVERVELVSVVAVDGSASATTDHGQQVVGVVTNVQAPLLKIFTATDTEAVNASDQSGVVQRVRFIGA